MILQALNTYYERAESLPRDGWVRRGIDYIVVLDEKGRCLNIELVGEWKKAKFVPREMLVPAIGKQAMKHTNSGKDANLLWDNASFIFGTGNKGAIKISSFIDTLQEWFGGMEDIGVNAVLQFCRALQASPQIRIPLLEQFSILSDFEVRDPILAFRLASDIEGVHARRTVRDDFKNKLLSKQAAVSLRGNCLVTGKMNVPLAQYESVIKGVWGGQSAGCNIISFNERSFESYGKRERNGENAPVSLHASFAYTTALNHLLASKQRIQIGDTSTVFWTERVDGLETAPADIFGEPPKDDPDRNTRAVHSLYEAVHSGKLAGQIEKNQFHILGLAPNAARISVRFYHCLPLHHLATRIIAHFEDLRIVRSKYDSEYPSLFRLLTSLAVLGKADNIPPNLGGAIIDAVFNGEKALYPSQLLNAAILRCKADQARKDEKGFPVRHVSHVRASSIKAYLNRYFRIHEPDRKEIPVSLDISITDKSYLLGRLFATYERMQEVAAERDLNRTIRDSFFGAAMATPASVFPRLVRLNQHHLRDLRRNRIGTSHYFDRLLREINDKLSPPPFPNHFDLKEQGVFALGYYQQRHDFFTKYESKQTSIKEQQS